FDGSLNSFGENDRSFALGKNLLGVVRRERNKADLTQESIQPLVFNPIEIGKDVQTPGVFFLFHQAVHEHQSRPGHNPASVANNKRRSFGRQMLETEQFDFPPVLIEKSDYRLDARDSLE